MADLAKPSRRRPLAGAALSALGGAVPVAAAVTAPALPEAPTLTFHLEQYLLRERARAIFLDSTDDWPDFVGDRAHEAFTATIEGPIRSIEDAAAVLHAMISESFGFDPTSDCDAWATEAIARVRDFLGQATGWSPPVIHPDRVQAELAYIQARAAAEEGA